MRLNISSLSRAARWAGRFALHILFPKTCFSCGADLPFEAPGPLCASCAVLVRAPGPLICRRCGTVLPSGGAHCVRCRGSKGDKFKCKVIRSAWLFGPQTRALIHAFKYAGYGFLAEYLGGRMAEEFKKYPELAGAEAVVPVPLHPKKKRVRGYNQSELLAREFSRRTGIMLRADWLRRVRDTAAQARLKRAARLANMSGAFCAPPDVKGKVILLMDDVATTGATLEGCAEALKASGAKRVLAFTLAREP